MDIIKFNGEEFPFTIVNMPFGERKISTTKLNECLMNSEGGYVSEEARFIDEGIFFFVEEEVISLPENEIVAIILSQI